MTELVSIIPESSTFCQVKVETSTLKGKLPKKTHLFHSHLRKRVRSRAIHSTSDIQNVGHLRKRVLP